MQNNLAHATMYAHDLPSTDFLLVRANGQEEQVLIRKVNGMFCVGQVEPQLEVFTPETHMQRTHFTRWIENFMTFIYAGVLVSLDWIKLD